MNRKIAKHLIPGLLLVLLLAQTGCYSQAYYPSYGTGYEANGPYNGGYPAQGYGSNYQNGYGQQGYQGYYGQDGYGQDYQGNDDDDDDDDYRERRYDQNRPWQANPYGGYYGR